MKRILISAVLLSLAITMTACENSDNSFDDGLFVSPFHGSSRSADNISSGADDDDASSAGEDSSDNETEKFKNDIESLIQQENFDEALSRLNSAGDQISRDAVDDLKKKFNEALDSAISKKVTSCFDESDYRSALTYLRNMSEKYDLESIGERMKNLESDFVDHILKAAENAAAQGNYSEAVSIIEKGSSEVDNNEKLNSAREEYSRHIDIYITDMEYMSCEGNVVVDKFLTDNTNNTHTHSLYIDASGVNSYWAEYYLNGRYTSFSGVVACEFGNRDSRESKYFEIYGDGELLYTSPVMTRSSVPVDFEVDTAGIKVMKILYPATEGNSKIAAIFDGVLKAGS